MAAPIALVCGHTTLDRIGGALVPGGSVTYAAGALAALGADVRVLTAAAADFPSEAFATATHPGTIDALVLPAAATTTFENSYAPDGRRSQRVLARAPPIDLARLPADWRAADLLLIAPVLGELDPAQLVGAVRAPVVGLSVQGLVRTVGEGGSVSPCRWEPDRRTLAGVTAAFLGEDEASAQPDLVARLAAAVPIVAFTRGGRGCDLVVDGRERRVGVHPASVRDPTGAGDVFAAAFLLALAEGGGPVDAARLGAAAASIAVEGRGGEALPRVGEARERAARVPVAPAE